MIGENQLFERWRIDNKLSNADITPLEKLSFIGKRGMGALEFVPDVSRTFMKERIDIPSLVELAQKNFYGKGKRTYLAGRIIDHAVPYSSWHIGRR